MKIIVTHDHHIYNATDGLDLIEFDTWTESDIRVTDPFVVDLPYELIIVIIKKLFYTLILETQFQLAFELCLLNRDLAAILYNEIYQTDQPRVTAMCTRICKTFMILESIHDDYITEDNNENCGRAAINLVYSQSFLPVYHPWDFRSEIEINELLINSINFEQINAFHGDTFGENVWVFGQQRNGIIDSTGIYSPVLVLIFTDYTGSLVLSRKALSKTNTYRSLTKLLTMIYGVNCKVFFMIRPVGQDNNPFVTGSSEFISYQ